MRLRCCLSSERRLANRVFEDNGTVVEGEGEVVDMMLLVFWDWRMLEIVWWI